MVPRDNSPVRRRPFSVRGLVFQFKTGQRHSHTPSFRIEMLPGTAPIPSCSYRKKPAISRQVDIILDSHVAAGLIEHRLPNEARDGSLRLGVRAVSVARPSRSS